MKLFACKIRNLYAIFFTRVMVIVNQIRSYEEDLTDQKNFDKTFRSHPRKFDVIVVSIEETKDLTHLSFNELMPSLQSHKQRMNRSLEKYGKTNISRDKFENSSHEEVLNEGEDKKIEETEVEEEFLMQM